jgi:type II secretory pathway component GspD/PulD (secretin)
MIRSVALLLALAAAIPADAQDPRKSEYESKLKNLKLSLDFKEAPLEQVVDYLREIADLNLLADAKVREKGISISLKVSELTLHSILKLMLQPHGCDVMYLEGVLMLMTKEDIADRTVKMELYDCRDILHPIRNFPGVDIDLSSTGAGVLTTDLDADEGGEMPIEELVRTHTGGGSWEDNPKAVVRLQNGLLVVKNTPEVHRQVRRLLDLLRENK